MIYTTLSGFDVEFKLKLNHFILKTRFMGLKINLMAC